MCLWVCVPVCGKVYYAITSQESLLRTVLHSNHFIYPSTGLKELLDPVETFSNLVYCQLCNYIVHGSKKNIFHKVETSICRDAGSWIPVTSQSHQRLWSFLTSYHM